MKRVTVTISVTLSNVELWRLPPGSFQTAAGAVGIAWTRLSRAMC